MLPNNNCAKPSIVDKIYLKGIYSYKTLVKIIL